MNFRQCILVDPTSPLYIAWFQCWASVESLIYPIPGVYLGTYALPGVCIYSLAFELSFFRVTALVYGVSLFIII